MFHFPRLPPPGLCVQPGVMAHDRHRVAPFGNPGISLLDGSSWLIAVIPRPSSARSAKASTVRRSHLTCATPRACTADREPVPRVSCTPQGSPSRRAPRSSSPRGKVGDRPPRKAETNAVISACRQNHTRTSRALPAAQATVRRESFPQPPLMSWTGPWRPVPEGMLWTHLITMSLVKAHPAVGRPDALRGHWKAGCKKQS